MTFKKATKKQAKLRLALFGVSGGGKTYSALRLATGLGGRIALIDTERGSASKYSDRFDFDVCEIDKPSIENIKLLINEAKGYDVLIIDSLTHAWLELLQEVERVAKAKFGGNTWSAWSEGTPKQTSLINALLDFPGHIIATMRAETNWTTTINDRGKLVPVRIGEAPKQGKSIEYEFDMLMQISQEHQAVVLKDRTGKFQDRCFIIDEEFGKKLKEWLNDGKAATESVEQIESQLSDLEPSKQIWQEDHKTNVVVEERSNASDEDFVEEFKTRIKKLLNVGQTKLFMKQNELSIKNPQSIRSFMTQKDLELEIAKFLEVVEK